MIVGEFSARQQGIDESKTLLWMPAHGDGNGAVEFHDRRWLDTNQPVVECRDLLPVCRCCGWSFGVNRSNGGLQRIGAETVRCKSALG